MTGLQREPVAFVHTMVREEATVHAGWNTREVTADVGRFGADTQVPRLRAALATQAHLTHPAAHCMPKYSLALSSDEFNKLVPTD